MATLEASGENAEQIKYWNETAAPRWIAFQQALDEQLGPLGRLAMDRGAIAPGDRVLDVGCGCGHTTLELARRVGPSGSVVGIDVSTAMLERLAESARTIRVNSIQPLNADAQTHEFMEESFDVVFSRFGVMFFADPVAAFANLRAALRRGGRLSFVCWQPMKSNPWMALPIAALASVMPLPAPPPPGAPGPFSFADAERVRGILEKARFGDLAIEPHEEVLTIGGGRELEDAVGFLLQLGPVGAALREAPEDVRERAADAVRKAIAPFGGPEGVRMDSASWLVTARRAEGGAPR